MNIKIDEEERELIIAGLRFYQQRPLRHPYDYASEQRKSGRAEDLAQRIRLTT